MQLSEILLWTINRKFFKAIRYPLKTLYPDTYFISFLELKALQLYLIFFQIKEERERLVKLKNQLGDDPGTQKFVLKTPKVKMLMIKLLMANVIIQSQKFYSKHFFLVLEPFTSSTCICSPPFKKQNFPKHLALPWLSLPGARIQFLVRLS